MLSLNLAATGVALAPAVAPRTTRTSGARGVSTVAASNPPWARRRWGCPAASGGVEAVECSSSGSRTGEELRALLERLQAEAEATRSKANGARLRLIRLSEAVEQLQKQAASSVRAGKLDDAREILVQKHKVMEALERSKDRVELFDKLAVKLNEAISLKETELIGNVASQSAVEENLNSPIRIVSSKMVTEHEVENEFSTSHDQNLEKTSEMDLRKVPDSDSVDYTWPSAKFKQSFDSIDDEKLNTLMGVTSYEAFIEHVDIQLKGVEDDLLALLRVSNLIMGGEQQQENTNTRRTSEILQDVSRIRAKIAGFIQNSTDES